MSERVLIAGCGDVGQRIAQRLLDRGDEVYALRRRVVAEQPAGIRWISADLTDAQSLRAVPADITQLVFAPTPDTRDETAYRRIFVEGLQNMLAALNERTIRRVVFVSSTAVYGDHDGAWVDEATSPAPMGFNGRILLEAEAQLATLPIPSIVMRLAGLYGPGRMHLIEQLRAGNARVPRATPHWVNRMHVDDAAAAIAHVLALDDPQRLYLGVDDTPLPLDVLYDYVAALLHAPPVEDGPAPPGVGSKRLSNRRLRASGFRCEWPDARAGYANLLKSC